MTRTQPTKAELLAEAEASGVQRRAARKPANATPLSPAEQASTHEFIGVLQRFLIGIREDIVDPPAGPRARTELRERIEIARGWLQAIEGPHYDRNYRWSLIVHRVRAARRAKKVPTSAEVAAWPELPPDYAASPKACGLIAKATVARGKQGWLKALCDAIAQVDRVHVAPGSLEAIVSDSLKVERRLKGADPDE